MGRMTERVVTECVLIIGNEILSGRTQDANLKHIATVLGEQGVRVREARVVPDVENVIVDALLRRTAACAGADGGVPALLESRL